MKASLSVSHRARNFFSQYTSRVCTLSMMPATPSLMCLAALCVCCWFPLTAWKKVGTSVSAATESPSACRTELYTDCSQSFCCLAILSHCGGCGWRYEAPIGTSNLARILSVNFLYKILLVWDPKGFSVLNGMTHQGVTRITRSCQQMRMLMQLAKLVGQLSRVSPAALLAQFENLAPAALLAVLLCSAAQSGSSCIQRARHWKAPAPVTVLVKLGSPYKLIITYACLDDSSLCAVSCTPSNNGYEGWRCKSMHTAPHLQSWPASSL